MIDKYDGMAHSLLAELLCAGEVRSNHARALAALVRREVEAEREACAKACEVMVFQDPQRVESTLSLGSRYWEPVLGTPAFIGPSECVAAIRARGAKEGGGK